MRSRDTMPAGISTSRARATIFPALWPAGGATSRTRPGIPCSGAAAAGICGAIATATRVTGILMWPALAWTAWRSASATSRDRAAAAGALIVAVLGFVGYCAFVYVNTGDPFLWATALTRWGTGYHP